MKLFRVILPVPDIDRATAFYQTVLNLNGERVSPGRHYFDLGGVVLACFDSGLEDRVPSIPNPQFIYISVADLELIRDRVISLGCKLSRGGISRQPWGERIFWTHDPFGNPIAFVDESTVLTTLESAPPAYDPLTGNDRQRAHK